MKYDLSKNKILALPLGEEIVFRCQTGREFCGIRAYAYILRKRIRRDDNGVMKISTQRTTKTIIIRIEATAESAEFAPSV